MKVLKIRSIPSGCASWVEYHCSRARGVAEGRPTAPPSAVVCHPRDGDTLARQLSPGWTRHPKHPSRHSRGIGDCCPTFASRAWIAWARVRLARGRRRHRSVLGSGGAFASSGLAVGRGASWQPGQRTRAVHSAVRLHLTRISVPGLLAAPHETNQQQTRTGCWAVSPHVQWRPAGRTLPSLPAAPPPPRPRQNPICAADD